MSIVKFGNTSLVEQPKRWEKTIAGTRVTRTWHTLTYADGLSAWSACTPGAEFDDLPWTLPISEAELNGTEGGSAILTVTCETLPFSGVTNTNNHPIYEREWVQESRAIETHPYFKDLTAASQAIVREADLEKVQANQAAILNKLAAGTQKTLGTALFNLLVANKRTYFFFKPVARRTTFIKFPSTGIPPTDSNTGEIENPPSQCGLDHIANAYANAFLKTTDRIVWQKGQFGTRVEEWTGAPNPGWDTDLYSS